MRGSLGLALRGQFDQSRNIHLRRGRATRKIMLNARKPRLDVALAPARDLYATNLELLGDLFVLHAVGGKQNDLGAQCQPHTTEPGASQFRQFVWLFLGQHYLWGNSLARSPTRLVMKYWKRENDLSSFKN